MVLNNVHSQLKANLNFNKVPILKNHVISICDAIEEDGFFKPIVDKIEPSGKFPKKCPIPAVRIHNIK